jgi:membrane protein implicated in regulation of membrane protease activity
LLIGFLIRALTPNPVRALAPNYVSMILPALSVVLTIVSSIGTGLLRRWAAIVFLVLTVLGMLSLFSGSFNAPGLGFYFLSIIAVILSWRWFR